VPLAELFLGKQRIPEIYLNVFEWGTGIYGADAAATCSNGVMMS
jgi:monofunctional biosynthetic peptidoglycan transglycosylase